MRNHELVAILTTLPPDAETMILYDGAARSRVDAAWLARSGRIVMGPRSEMVSDDRDRTEGAPSEADERHIHVGDMMGLPPSPEDEDDGD